MAYNPINTIDADGSATGDTDGQVAADALRMELFSAGGLPSFYGINIMEINQLGVDQSFNKLFAVVAAAEGSITGGGGTGSFSQSADEILIGIDRTKDALIRPTVIGEGLSDDLQILVDDQFSVRQNKIGYYGKVEEGRICIDDRALIGLVV